MRGDVKKFKVFVKDPKTGNIKLTLGMVEPPPRSVVRKP